MAGWLWVISIEVNLDPGYMCASVMMKAKLGETRLYCGMGTGPIKMLVTQGWFKGKTGNWSLFITGTMFLTKQRSPIDTSRPRSSTPKITNRFGCHWLCCTANYTTPRQADKQI